MKDSVSTHHIVEAGTKRIDALAFRKCRRLSCVTLPDGLSTIGVAAFCNSGLVTIQFLGIPKVIETEKGLNSILGCRHRLLNPLDS